METPPLSNVFDKGVYMEQFKRKEDLRQEAIEQLDRLQQQRINYALKSWRDYFSQQATITNNNHGR